jgi:sucrose phosphorylase
VWTTFSADQVDLNYHNPEVLLEVIDTLLFFATQGADFIRLDAIAYLWKEIGTTCIHLPQTHRIIQLIRAVLDQVAPHVMLITETNVPHEENLSYFGSGYDEAQMVYNFALPPLVLYTLHTGDPGFLSDWAKGLSLPSKRVTYFNFLASHDGIGVNPVRGILPEEGVELLIEKTLEHGGMISYKDMPDGNQSPYELNINFFDALCNPGDDTPLQEQVDRFMAAQAIMLALVGVPGIYFHSLFGSRGWPEGVKITGRNRTVNRQKLMLEYLERELDDPAAPRFLVFEKFKRLLMARGSCSAFHPFGDQSVIDSGDSIFSIMRFSPDHTRSVLCLQNVSGQHRMGTINIGEITPTPKKKLRFMDLIDKKIFTSDQIERIQIQPYQSLWLEISSEE